MPSYHQYQGYRLDLTRQNDREQAEHIAARMEAIASETDGGDEWLLGRLRELSRSTQDASIDLLVFEPDYTSWTHWSMENGEVRRSPVTFRRVGEYGAIELDSDWTAPEIELPSAEALASLERTLSPVVSSFSDLMEGERSLIFPFEWSTDSNLEAGLEAFRPYLGHVPRLALAQVMEPAFGLRLVRLSDQARSTDIAVLEPWLEDPDRRAKLSRLWTIGTEVIHPQD